MSGDDLERIDGTILRMIGYCNDIAEIIHRSGDFQVFVSDFTYYNSAIFLLGQIGENTKQIYPWLSSNTDYDWSSVVRTRDLLYHNYSNVNYGRVWDMMNNDVPDVLQLLKELHEDIISRPLVSENRKKRRIFGLFKR